MNGAAAAGRWTVRWSRREWSRLLQAFGLSVLLHLFLYGAYALARYWQLPPDFLLPARLRHTHQLQQAIAARREALEREESPLVFVEVSPRQATEEPPPETRFYSDKHSRAANPEADQDTGQPRITGTQDQVAKTETVPPAETYEPLQPAVTPPQPAEPPPPAPPLVTPTLPRPEGDLEVGRPDWVERRGDSETPRPRPRTLAEARARQSPALLPGEKMRQEGGVKNRLEFSALDARATPFGDYDAALVRAVADRWYALLDAKRYAGYQRGRVVVRFLLHSDGRVTDLQVVESTVGLDLSLICEMAVLDPAPYAPWPRELRRLVEGNYRKVQFTFYYN
ncbi:hypothetical protein [Limisphaera sp. VF-2]|jgi:outer membrane biosynthesis protein TonB|uniref:hypothetical protein n=1 Tax=Limisphaera sp. VF-2 TaxID=3400418 RepID=UPI0017541568